MLPFVLMLIIKLYFLTIVVFLMSFNLIFIDYYTCVIPFTVALNSNFHPFPSIQEWAANNETRGQIEDTVLYGYYSKCILLIHVHMGAHKKNKINICVHPN